MPCSARGRYPTGSDGEFEHSPLTRKFGETGDRRPQYVGGEHSGARGGIPLGSIDIPDLVLSHGSDDVNERLQRPRVFQGVVRRTDLPRNAHSACGRTDGGPGQPVQLGHHQRVLSAALSLSSTSSFTRAEVSR